MTTPHFVHFDGLRERRIQSYSLIKAGCPPPPPDQQDDLTLPITSAGRFCPRGL